MWSSAASLLALAPLASAQLKGFNYGSTNNDGSCRGYADFVRFFTEAKSLAGGGSTSPPFAAARLYTSVQCGTAADPIAAFRAAVDTDTALLVGLWASAGRAAYERELDALLRGVRELGAPLADRVVGLAVGSEDLYRSSPQGVANNAGAGASGPEIEGYVGWLRDWARGTLLESKPVGHVDTWTAWVLPENRGVADSVDFLGHNSFPYFETTRPNSIDQAADNFWSALAQTESVSSGKEVWVTETGWPHEIKLTPSGRKVGPNSGAAVANLDNAQRYWHDIGCPLFGSRNTFWYTLKDANTAQTDISFAVTPLENNTPYFDLRC
ncbi:glycoside hydrolase family 17 protein [Apiospora kogelbergensis]|uniref:Probable glucan endo-1,3-beta-glucosidase eglC n=1 Tax=Apiospora kogelbergensis TaxID=1337665 RepID=A0AAW0QIE2_9PEZI